MTVPPNFDPPQHTTHIHKVEIKLAHSNDPNRIARKVMEMLQESVKSNKCVKCKEIYEYAKPVRGFTCWSCKNFT